MADYDYIITLPLDPRGKGSVRVGPDHGYPDRKTGRWMKDAATLFAFALPPTLLEGPYRVDILSVKQRTQEMRKRFKKTGIAKYGEGLLWCPQFPDQDNIRKMVLDSLKRHLTDDRAVVSGETTKYYSEIDGLPRVVVRIRRETRDPAVVYRAALGGD